MDRFTFDAGEIEFVADNMDACTRAYVVAAHRAAMARARRKSWPDDARGRMRNAAEKMKKALDTWPKGHFDMKIPNADDQRA